MDINEEKEKIKSAVNKIIIAAGVKNFTISVSLDNHSDFLVKIEKDCSWKESLLFFFLSSKVIKKAEQIAEEIFKEFKKTHIIKDIHLKNTGPFIILMFFTAKPISPGDKNC